MKRRLKKGSENMKYNLRKKKRAWDLFRKEIKILIGICFSLALGITVWFNWEAILKFIQWLNLIIF